MQDHPTIGVRITQHLTWFGRNHLDIIRHHHERWDGRGYPDKLGGKAIPLLARVAALCDVSDALTNDRPYRSGLPMSKALKIIAEGRGTQFDPDLTDRFLALMAGLQSFIRTELQAEDARSITWTDDRMSVALLTPEGEKRVNIEYDGARWVRRPGDAIAEIPLDLHHDTA